MIRLSAVLAIAVCVPLFAQQVSVEPHDSIFKDTLAEMSWPQVKDAGQKHAIVLFPIGVVEEHGPHMDLTPDIYLACLVSRNIKALLEAEGIATVMAPPYYWGITDDTSEFPGSFSVRAETMQAVLRESIGSLGRWGFDRIFLVNLHGNRNQHRAIRGLVEELTAAAGGPKVYDAAPLLRGPHQAQKPGKYSPDFHSGADETKMVWDYYPAKVNATVARTLEPQKTLLPLGYAGDPAHFMENGEGRPAIEALSRRGAEKIQALLADERNR